VPSCGWLCCSALKELRPCSFKCGLPGALIIVLFYVLLMEIDCATAVVFYWPDPLELSRAC